MFGVFLFLIINKKKQFNMTIPIKVQSALDFNPVKQETIKEFKYADFDNIKECLPYLFLEQQEDVLRIEERFKVGKGYLITNGTGTGKTLVGLGVVKRFLLMDKKQQLIVVPSDQKCIDWIKEAQEHFQNIDIHKLEDTCDVVNGINVTTYANFYQNKKLINRLWDLIIYDECHYLTQNSEGSQTVYLTQHKNVSNVWSTSRSKAIGYVGAPLSRESYNYSSEYAIWKEKYDATVKKLQNKTKVLFLSATPFAYHKSLIYGDGTIFEMNEKEVPKQQRSYGDTDGYQDFMIEHLGYRMAYSKLTIPDSGVDQDLLERQLFENFYEKGVMSTRQLQVSKDYSRHFITVNAKEAELLNKGMETVYSNKFSKEFKYLHEYLGRHFTYLYISKLLETIKAKYIHTRIQQHLDLDRQVVVFHSFNTATAEHPFRFDAMKMIKKDEGFLERQLKEEIKRFKEIFPHFWNLDLSDLKNSRDAIKEHFPDALEFNGTISKKKRSENIKLFQSDLGNSKLILVQSKAGREGISLHDTTGLFERVMIDLSLPTAPTEAIQKEGRTYRYGVKSNAIYEYIVVGYSFEEIAFATKIAQRAKTVENLALGNAARDLETAFKEGYFNHSYNIPNITQGRKSRDKDKIVQVISEFDKAKTYYYGRQKNKGQWKTMDYFATPEPLGYKIIEWLDMAPGEKFLEPSAGHGAISRFTNKRTDNHFVEPVLELASKLAIFSSGKIHQHTFEDFSIMNKFNYIAMNPPYGSNSKLAYEHIQKAFLHAQRHGCTIIAIVPQGPASEQRLERLLEDKINEHWYLRSKVLLPSCVFKKESTQVLTQILKFQTVGHYGPNMLTLREIDLTHIEDIEEFFTAINQIIL